MRTSRVLSVSPFFKIVATPLRGDEDLTDQNAQAIKESVATPLRGDEDFSLSDSGPG